MTPRSRERFWEPGVLDRFGQIAPKIFVSVDGYWVAHVWRSRLVGLPACFNSTQSPGRRGFWGASALTSR
jgi:hypothetical protein